MQFSIFINQDKALEWGLNAQQAMLFAFLYEVPSWAKPTDKGGVIYYHISKGKVVQEMPLLTDKPDTVYRLMKQLQDKGLLALTNSGPYTLMALTEKGKTWNQTDAAPRKNLRGSGAARGGDLPRRNIRSKQPLTSEKSPGKVGEKSEVTPEKSPTDQLTKSDNQSETSPCGPPGPPNVSESVWADYVDHRKAKRAKLTGRAVELITKKLEGLSPPLADECLNESIENGWTGVFPERMRSRTDENRSGHSSEGGRRTLGVAERVALANGLNPDGSPRTVNR